MNFKLSLFIFFLLSFAFSSCTYYCGKDKLVRQFTATPMTIPAVYDYTASFSDRVDYDIHDPLIQSYADEPLPTDMKVASKTDAVRRIMAKLIQQREVPQINALLMTLRQWSDHGTTSGLHPHGDYDFTEISFCSLLYLFGDKPELLYPATRQHILDSLIGNSGPKISERMPGFIGIFRETENHILMGEVSRYLKNQWLHEHGDTSYAYDNHRNGIEKWMAGHLEEKFRGGFYEFNSDPYSGYSLQAILTLFSFTHSDTVRHAANKLLNEIMYEYSLSSINESRYPPFRRQTHRAGRTNFDSDPLSSIVRVLINQKTGQQLNIREKQHGLITLLLHYRLNDALADLILNKKQHYFALLGHGRKGSPEIYDGGKGYVLSAGGIQRGKISQLAARQTILLLNDHIGNRDSCFYLSGRGTMPHWNNTGVYYNFACADQPVSIPPQYKPSLVKGDWQIFHAPEQIGVVTYSAKNIGILMVVDGLVSSDEGILNELINANTGVNLKKQFMLPGHGLISYRPHSPKNRWVISKVNGQKTNRLYDKWQRMNIMSW